MDSETVGIVSGVMSNLGFPVFVAVWLLFRTDKRIDQLSQAILSLRDIVGDSIAFRGGLAISTREGQSQSEKPPLETRN